MRAFGFDRGPQPQPQPPSFISSPSSFRANGQRGRRDGKDGLLGVFSLFFSGFLLFFPLFLSSVCSFTFTLLLCLTVSFAWFDLTWLGLAWLDEGNSCACV
ncbi:hypothetical protein F4809DRAFT_602770 [Biscogniauxia mediterranea]|nr:hypothetical protein F4809DRAFT_602770 [Biscogniauxia mediterranea]